MLLKFKYISIFNTCGKKKQVKENFVSFVKFAIPISMPNNIPISPIIENVPIVEKTRIIENV
jgi:hypothetical protein